MSQPLPSLRAAPELLLLLLLLIVRQMVATQSFKTMLSAELAADRLDPAKRPHVLLLRPRKEPRTQLLVLCLRTGFPVWTRTREDRCSIFSPSTRAIFTETSRGTMQVYVAVIFAYGVSGKLSNFSFS